MLYKYSLLFIVSVCSASLYVQIQHDFVRISKMYCEKSGSFQTITAITIHVQNGDSVYKTEQKQPWRTNHSNNNQCRHELFVPMNVTCKCRFIKIQLQQTLNPRTVYWALHQTHLQFCNSWKFSRNRRYFQFFLYTTANINE